MRSTRLALCINYFVFFGAMGIYFPYLPVWLQLRGFSGLQISLIAALLPTMSVLSPPIFGVLADAMGLRGSILRIAAAGALLAIGSLAVYSGVGGELTFLVVFACVLGFTFFRAAITQLADVVALEFPADYGRMRLWGSIGFMLVALLAGKWMDLQPVWLMPLLISVAFGAVYAISWLLPKRTEFPSAPALKEARRLLRDGNFQLFLLCSAIGQAAQAGYDLCITLHLTDLGATGTTIGSAWAIATLAEVVLMAFTGWLFRRATTVTWFMLTLAVSFGRWAFLATATDLSLIVALQPLHGITFGVRWVCSLMLVRQFASTQTMATTQGLWLAALSLGGAASMPVWGALYDGSGAQRVFGCAALLALLATGFALMLRSRMQHADNLTNTLGVHN